VKVDIAEISKVGLGCSRMGSIGAVGADDPTTLIKVAIGGGINVFDTADIYGQGRSEKILGKTSSYLGCRPFLITKAGQYFPFHLRALKPAKAMAVLLSRRSSLFRSVMSTARAGHLPTDFSTKRIRRCFAASAKRLAPQRIDVFLLHGPSAETIASPELRRLLRALLEEQLVGRIGVSCNDVDSARAAVRSGVHQVLELPLSTTNRRFVDVAREAKSEGLVVIAREVLGGIRASEVQLLSELEVVDRVAAPIENQWADTALIGTTNAGRLRTLITHLQARGILGTNIRG
jgi:aryl-alcohol dehydrogenase-like predicted oxidoreductase